MVLKYLWIQYGTYIQIQDLFNYLHILRKNQQNTLGKYNFFILSYFVHHSGLSGHKGSVDTSGLKRSGLSGFYCV